MTQSRSGVRDGSHYYFDNLIVHFPAVAVETTARSLRWHRKFHTVRKYGLHGDNRLHFGHIPFVHKYDRVHFLALLIDEYNLRLNMQEQERIERRLYSLLPPLGSDNSEHRDYPDDEKGICDVYETGTDCNELSPLLHHSSGVSYQYPQVEPNTTQIPAFQKTLQPRATKSREEGISILKHKLNDAKRQHSLLSQKLYEIESMLPDEVKRNYESIRKDPKWYMRRELVNDCANRGGCCGRDCGCCAFRAKQSYEKGIGHCTVECFCCVGSRGRRPSPEEKRDILKRMTMDLKCDIATHFVRMVNAYFTKP